MGANIEIKRPGLLAYNVNVLNNGKYAFMKQSIDSFPTPYYSFKLNPMRKSDNGYAFVHAVHF